MFTNNKICTYMKNIIKHKFLNGVKILYFGSFYPIKSMLLRTKVLNTKKYFIAFCLFYITQKYFL